MLKALCVAGLVLAGSATPFDIPLRSTSAAPTAKGAARLQYAASPFGVAVTADGRASYDVRFVLDGLPEPATLGAFTTYLAWMASPDLKTWRRLGTVRNGTTVVGQADLNKFLIVVTAEADSMATERKGPTILHGPSPSTWLQSMLTHPLFRGIPPG
ncbi:MAG TPA: hypothetical protein VJU15_14875 [Gemmatimonadales bacterium]|nr:hypothetical protein [Gemmatimonadales bacterium]